MTSEQARDKMWGEIRQLILNEGPVVEVMDAAIAEEEGFLPEDREAFVAQFIAQNCARIAQISPGPFTGVPLTFILGTWAGLAMEEDAEMAAMIFGGGIPN